MSNPTDDMGNWGGTSPQNPDSGGSSGWDSWNSWDANTQDEQQDNQFIQPDDLGQGGQYIQQDSVDNFQQDDFDSPVAESGVAFNVGHKTAALVVAGLCIVVALILYFINSIHITPNNTQQIQSQIIQEEEQLNNQTSTPANDIDEFQTQPSTDLDTSGKAVLVEIPSSMAMEYSSDSYNANGKIISKQKYVMGSQIVYCLSINVTLASSNTEISHFCSYATYNSVGIGDVVSITYQIVNDNYISINSISK